MLIKFYNVQNELVNILRNVNIKMKAKLVFRDIKNETTAILWGIIKFPLEICLLFSLPDYPHKLNSVQGLS